MREFRDEEGRAWEALALDAVVAHGKQGAVLAFRPAGEPGSEPVRSNITFNSTTPPASRCARWARRSCAGG